MTDTPEPPKKPRPAPRRSSRSSGTTHDAKAKPKPAAKAPATKKDQPSATGRAKRIVDAATKRDNRGRLLGGVAAGLGAAGAIVAGVMVARRRATTDAPLSGAKSHQADGKDSSAEFRAGIADEGIVPDKLPD